MKINKHTLALFFILFISLVLHAQDWKPKEAALMTRFSKDVSPDHVLPEYPRPQMVRSKWLNLNGLWQYQPGAENDELPQGNLTGTILVPFPVESPLSGVKEHHERLWYRCTFTIPNDWKEQHVLLHFGAVDFESEVFINGKSMGVHKGGYDPFTLDITPALKPAGKQEITVRVYDPTDAGGQPRGKQTLNPRGIMYTSTTGIWQTVWLEPVPSVSISDIKMVPDIDQSVLKLTVHTNGNAADLSVAVKVKDGSNVVQSTTGKAGTEISIPIRNEKLWSPDHPFLYDLSISLLNKGKVIDTIGSYFGMRKISLGEENGIKKLFLNNHFLFEIGPLDQGFWPDGNYTAPTDAAIKNDLQMMKAFGYNMVRKHIKVEPYRWYYWADRLGLMVWQDMPSANSYTEHTPPVDTAEYASELTRLVTNHWNSPCIVMWVIFNEGQGQHNTPGLVNMVRGLDSSRLINQASGGEHFGVGDVMDIHSYAPPACPDPSSTQALACGEYGGIGYRIPGHLWDKGFSYIMIDDKQEYMDTYKTYAMDLNLFKTNQGLSAAVYTEITDVERELNGVLTYDRLIKADVPTMRNAITDLINKKLYLTEVVPSSQHTPQQWQYTFDKPDTNWTRKDFNAANWKTGEAGFGTKEAAGSVVRTDWNTKDIWLRRTFTLGDLSGIDKHNLVLYLYHDDDCEVYINGVKAAKAVDHTSEYSIALISEAALKALVSGGENTIAIHCKQKDGGQYIDAGISLMSYDKPAPSIPGNK